jgi:hypothetical protein
MRDFLSKKSDRIIPWNRTKSDTEAIVMEQEQWEKLTPEQKKKELYLEQKFTLDSFLERNAISKAMYDKSLHDLTEKMGMQQAV